MTGHYVVQQKWTQCFINYDPIKIKFLKIYMCDWVPLLYNRNGRNIVNKR